VATSFRKGETLRLSDASTHFLRLFIAAHWFCSWCLHEFLPCFDSQAKLDDEKLPDGWKKERDPETGTRCMGQTSLLPVGVR
jgi:hypothetical protein